MALARRALCREQNPFLAAELRAQARRHAFFRDLLVQACALSLLFFGFLVLVRWPGSSDLMRALQRELSPQLVTVVAAAHAWMVIHASDSRVREAAQREETARMWEMLLVTPLSPTEIVLFKSVYPAFYAGLVALLALPIYLLAAAMSGIPFSRLLMLYGVYGLLLARLVAPLRPADADGGRRRRRPSLGASAFGNLIGWIWLLSWAGGWLFRASPFAGMLIFLWPVTWPVVAASVLPTAYSFYRLNLPPFVVLLVLGPALFLLNLRWAGRRLTAYATEAPGPETPGLLRRAVVLGTALAILGYAWPRLIESGSLGVWAHLGVTARESVAALGWLLLALWWLLFGLGGLLTLPGERGEAGTFRPPRFYSGWLSGAESARGSAATIIGLVVSPLLILAAACALSGRLPAPALLPWLGRAIGVAIGAAALTAALAARLRAAVRADSAGGMVVASLQAFGLIIVPLVLLYWPDTTTLRLAALSPAMGFLALLPPSAPLSPGVSAPPWWLSPVLNLATAALLLRGARKERSGAGMTVTPVRRQSRDGLLSRWAERVAARWDQPVLVKELRAGARRGDWRRLLTLAATGSLILAFPELFFPEYIAAVASAIPLRFFPSDLPELRLSCASVMTVIIMVLTWLMVFSAPVLGSAAFTQERRKGTLGFLLATPLHEGQIVQGKLLGVAAPLLLALMLTFPAAGLAALLSLSLPVLWSFLFSYAWLLIACLTGSAFGVLASLLPGRTDRHALPLMAVFTLQAVKLYGVARLQYLLTGAPWLNSKMEITAWYVVPLVALEAGVGLLAYAAGVVYLAHSRRRDLRSVAEK